MPKTSKSGDAKKSELPDTLKKSNEKAQRTFAESYAFANVPAAASPTSEGRGTVRHYSDSCFCKNDFSISRFA